MVGSILTELNERLIPAGWTCERDDTHYRWSSPDKAQVIELSQYPGEQGGTVVDGFAFGEPISMRYVNRPIELVLDALERWGALPQAVTR